MTESLSLFLLILSLYLLDKFFEVGLRRYFYLSGIIFGLALHAREQILIFLPWSFALFVIYRKYNWKLMISYLMVIIISFLIPLLLFYLSERDIAGIFTSYFMNTSKVNAGRPIVDKISSFWDLTPKAIFILFLAGAYSLRKFFILGLGVFLPFVMTLLITYGDERNFIPFGIILALLSAYGLNVVVKSVKGFFLILILVLFFSINIIDNFPRLLRDNIFSKSYKIYEEKLLANFPERAVFLVGDKTWLVNSYLRPLAKPEWRVMASGWGWPGREKTVDLIREYLSEGMPVYVDRNEYDIYWEAGDMDYVLARFKLVPYFDSLQQITARKG